MSNGHDVRVHRPGESAECSQCGRAVWGRWVEMPRRVGEAAVEVMVWCRGCLLEHVGVEAGEVARARREDERPDAAEDPLRRETATTCPKRMQGAGSWERAEGLDGWRRQGPEGFSVDWEPRTCSFCGSLHGRDLFRMLVEEEWVAEWARGKQGYKAYVYAPEGQRTGRLVAKVYTWHLTDDQRRNLGEACSGHWG